MKFIQIPAGKFTMGSPASEKDRYTDEAQREVVLEAFEIADTQVTQDLWTEMLKSPATGLGRSWIDETLH